ncbi:MAG: hypothetical protein ACYC3S_04885 [Chloroflexota bacterium]
MSSIQQSAAPAREHHRAIMGPVILIGVDLFIEIGVSGVTVR